MAIPTTEWMKQARCKNFDTELFFDKYEEDVELREDVDTMCSMCPVARHCLANGVSHKGWGVWGGIYLVDGEISREFNNHKTKAKWAATWKYLTVD
jgi:hypothetical protein